MLTLGLAKQIVWVDTNSRTVLLGKTQPNVSQTQLKGNLTMKKTFKAEQCSGKATSTCIISQTHGLPPQLRNTHELYMFEEQPMQ